MNFTTTVILFLSVAKIWKIKHFMLSLRHKSEALLFVVIIIVMIIIIIIIIIRKKKKIFNYNFKITIHCFFNIEYKIKRKYVLCCQLIYLQTCIFFSYSGITNAISKNYKILNELSFKCNQFSMYLVISPFSAPISRPGTVANMVISLHL